MGFLGQWILLSVSGFTGVLLAAVPFDEPVNPIMVYALSGGKVALPCNITPPSSDDEVSLILWYKDESPTPIYSLDSRRGDLSQARHAASDILAPRAYLSTVHKPASLHLDPVTEEDQGEYRCRVDFRKARTRHDVVYVQIIVPPGKPVIMDQSGEILPSIIGPYNEGDPLHLVCETSSGRPPPSLTWWRDSVLLDDTFDVNRYGIVRNALHILRLERQDLMAMFRCQASNNNISAPVSSSVTVDLNFKPLAVRIEGDLRPLSADKSVEIVCRAAGSRPPATISWWKGSTRMKQTREKASVDGNVTESVLTFTPTSEDSGKYLSCRAENPAILGSALEDGWKLEVHYVPQLTLRLGSKLRHSHIQEGNDVYFECNIRANPWVTEIRWWFEGRETHTNTSAGIIVSSQSLVLQRVQKTNRGKYMCSASNTEGEGRSNSVHLRVQYAPVCRAGQKILYGAARHETVKVTCEVDADPSEVTFRWAFNNSANNVEVSTFVSDGTTSTATYIPRTEFDYGTLICWAKNSVGMQQEPCLYTIIPAGPPDAVQNCSVTNQTEDSMHVDCTESYDGGLLQHFVLEVHEVETRKLRANITSITPSFVARGLAPGKMYALVLYAANAKGRSRTVTVMASTLAPPESLTRKGNAWQLGFSPVLASLIVIVVALVLISLVIVLALKFRQRRDLKRISEDTKERLQDPLRKDGAEERYDMCVYSADSSDDKCPDVIPDLTLVMERNKECSESDSILIDKTGSASDFGTSWATCMTSSNGETFSTSTFPRAKKKSNEECEDESTKKGSSTSSGTLRESSTQKQWKLRFPGIPRDIDDSLTSECPSITFRQTDV